MGNPFAGVGETERAGADGSFFTAGKSPSDGGSGTSRYLVLTNRFVTFESKNPDTEGEDVVVYEGIVLKVLEGDEQSNKVGSSVKSINKLFRLRSGKLTQAGSFAMGRVKGIAAALLGGVDDSELTEGTLWELTQSGTIEVEGVKEEYGEGEASKGLVVEVTCKWKGKYQNAFFAYAGDEE